MMTISKKRQAIEVKIQKLQEELRREKAKLKALRAKCQHTGVTWTRGSLPPYPSTKPEYELASDEKKYSMVRHDSRYCLHCRTSQLRKVRVEFKRI